MTRPPATCSKCSMLTYSRHHQSIIIIIQSIVGITGLPPDTVFNQWGHQSTILAKAQGHCSLAGLRVAENTALRQEHTCWDEAELRFYIKNSNNNNNN